MTVKDYLLLMIFLSGPTHTHLARYQISFNGINENQSSSGVIVSTGAGSTAWLSSLFNMASGINKAFSKDAGVQRRQMDWEMEKLVFVVREPFQSKSSDIDLSAGIIEKNNELTIESFMPENGIIFSDGIESDFMKFNSGSIVKIGIAKEKAKLVLRESKK